MSESFFIKITLHSLGPLVSFQWLQHYGMCDKHIVRIQNINNIISILIIMIYYSHEYNPYAAIGEYPFFHHSFLSHWTPTTNHSCKSIKYIIEWNQEPWPKNVKFQWKELTYFLNSMWNYYINWNCNLAELFEDRK